jgi:beta-glucosidase
MKFRSLLIIVLALLSFRTLYSQPTLEHRVDSLLALMSLDEKVGQLIQYSGTSTDHMALLRQGQVGSLLNVVGVKATREAQRIAVEETRLKIPLIFGLDVIHGFRTTFPIPLATACSWDLELIEKSERVAAVEATAAGIHWTFSPMVDIARDPRWGRIAEGAGEDSYLGALIAATRVRGLQGTSLQSPTSLLACAKHFAAYGGAEGGRDYNTVDISERTLREVYLPRSMPPWKQEQAL